MDQATGKGEFKAIWNETGPEAIGGVTIEPIGDDHDVRLSSQRTGRSVILKCDSRKLGYFYPNENAELAALDRAYDFKRVEGEYLDRWQELWSQCEHLAVDSEEYRKIRKEIVNTLIDFGIVKTFHEITTGG